MRISKRGRITIPKALRDRFGLNRDVEVEITPASRGLLVHKRAVAQHPLDRAHAVLARGGNTDDYLEEIRGR